MKNIRRTLRFLSGFWLLKVLLYLEQDIMQPIKLTFSHRPKTKVAAPRSGWKGQAQMGQGVCQSRSRHAPIAHQCLVHTVLSNRLGRKEGRKVCSLPGFWSILQHPSQVGIQVFLDPSYNWKLTVSCLIFT